MGFSLDMSVPIFTVFFQGLISFFSPCILPLVPLYISYLSGGAKTVAANGTIEYPRKQVMFNTIFFVLGISFAFFVLGLGVTSMGSFFSNNRLMFAKVSGIIMFFLGLYQLGFFGRSEAIEKEHRIPLRLESWTMGPLAALLLGFTFSFAWTPCVGPVLGSVLLMAASGSSGAGFALIGVFTVGFILPFLAVGLFTRSVLNFFKEHQSVVRYTVKIGAVLMIVMGVMTFTGYMNGFTSYLTGNAATAEENTQLEDKSSEDDEPAADEVEVVAAPDFTLMDQFGNTHTLSEYKGKTVFLNFWATWCPPCRGEMPHIQELYEEYGLNQEDVVILGVAAPNIGREGSKKEIITFLNENGYTFPVVMDESSDVFQQYGISAFPTTFMIDESGAVYGYVESAMEKATMHSIIEQTKESVEKNSGSNQEE